MKVTDREGHFKLGYDVGLRNYLVSGFKDGFHIEYDGNSECEARSNSCLLDSVHEAAEKKINSEIDAGRYMGPFTHKPFKHMHMSPLSICEKSTPGQYRLLHNLSYPYNSDSVNGGIQKHNATVKYVSIQNVMDYIVELGPNSYLGKVDIKSAFRLLPVHEDDHHLLSFKFKGKYYFIDCMAMGCSSSCNIFEKFSTVLQWIGEEKFGIPHSLHMLDDFLFLGESYDIVADSMEKFKIMCDMLGVPLAPEKEEGPSTILTFLGVELDTSDMIAWLPPDKLLKYSEEIRELLLKRSATLETP